MPSAITPLVQLRQSGQISIEMFLAALAYLADVEPAAMVSNTAAVCATAARMQINPAKERVVKAKALARRNESDGSTPASRARNEMVVEGLVGQMSGRDDSGARNDYDGAALRQIAAHQRYARTLDGWQINLLDDVLVYDIPLANLAHRWGVTVAEITKVVAGILDALAALQERTNPKYQETLSSYRRMIASTGGVA